MMSSARFIPANLDNCTGASVLETKCSENGPHALMSAAGGDAKDAKRHFQHWSKIVGNN